MSLLALTFDDGPDAAWTPPVLDALGRAGARATFFVVAEQLLEPAGPALLAAILDAGHSVQPHCARHVRHSELELEALRRDIANVLELLAGHGVPAPQFWRPPYGVLHPVNSRRVAAEVGLRLGRWTHDPRDYAGMPWRQMLAELAPIDRDAVILLHDSRRYTRRTDSAANTVALIEPLAASIAARGHEVGDLGAVADAALAWPPAAG